MADTESLFCYTVLTMYINPLVYLFPRQSWHQQDLSFPLQIMWQTRPLKSHLGHPILEWERWSLIIKRTYQWCLIKTPWRNGRDKRPPLPFTQVLCSYPPHVCPFLCVLSVTVISTLKPEDKWHVVCPSHSVMESMELQSNITAKFVWLLNFNLLIDLCKI